MPKSSKMLPSIFWLKFCVCFSLPNPFFQKTIVNRPALGVFPGADWPSKLRDVLLQVSFLNFLTVKGKADVNNIWKFSSYLVVNYQFLFREPREILFGKYQVTFMITTAH